MDAFSIPRNGASLSKIVDVTAHSISLFQENETLKLQMKYLYLKMILVLQNRLVFKYMN